MLVVLALLYAGYALSIKRWNYASQAELERRRTALKQAGLSNTFYFIRARTLFFLNILSGGTFVFYWIYHQWKAVLHGFKRLDGTSLRYGPLVRTIGGFFTFFTLINIINRTCEYMHKKPAWPAIWWGSWWLGGFVAIFLPISLTGRIFGFTMFCLAPAALQHRLNALPKTRLSLWPKPKEIIATAFGLVLLSGLFTIAHLIQK